MLNKRFSCKFGRHNNGITLFIFRKRSAESAAGEVWRRSAPSCVFLVKEAFLSQDVSGSPVASPSDTSSSQNSPGLQARSSQRVQKIEFCTLNFASNPCSEVLNGAVCPPRRFLGYRKAPSYVLENNAK